MILLLFNVILIIIAGWKPYFSICISVLFLLCFFLLDLASYGIGILSSAFFSLEILLFLFWFPINATTHQSDIIICLWPYRILISLIFCNLIWKICSLLRQITCSNCFKAPFFVFLFAAKTCVGDEIIWTLVVSVIYKLCYANFVKCSYIPVSRQQKFFCQHKGIEEIENILNKEFANICDYFVDIKLSTNFSEDKTTWILFSR